MIGGNVANRYLVIGADGLVGGAIYDALEQADKRVLNTTKDFFRLEDRNTLELIDFVEPDTVFLCAANTDVDNCETNLDAYRVNIVSQEEIIQDCFARKIKVVFFSSSYVFDGSKPMEQGGYTEEDTPRPLNKYGAYKLFVDNFIGNDGLVIRTVGVFGRGTKNFAYQVLKSIGERSIYTPDDQYMNPIHADDLAQIAITLVDRDVRGIVNVAGDRILSKTHWAYLIMLAANYLPNNVKRVKNMEQDAKRPMNGALNTDKLKSLGIAVPTFRSGNKRFAEWYLKQQS